MKDSTGFIAEERNLARANLKRDSRHPNESNAVRYTKTSYPYELIGYSRCLDRLVKRDPKAATQAITCMLYKG